MTTRNARIFHRSSALWIIATAFAWVLQAATGVHAATLTVNSADDELNVDGDCSLREAIASANADAQQDACAPTGGFGDDTILLPDPTTLAPPASAYTLSTVGTSLVINDPTPNSLTIDGTSTAAATIIQANAAVATATFRVFEVTAGNATFQDVTIRHGGGSGNGGGILFNSTNNSTLTVASCIIADQRTTGDGAGIHVTANPYTIGLTNTSFTGNYTTGAGANAGAINILGGSGVSTVSITNCTFTDNRAKGSAGAVRAGQNVESVTIVDSTFTNNLVDGTGSSGGAINSQADVISISDTAFTGNSSRAEGGALRIGAGATTTTIDRCLFANNSVVAGGADGGAIRELSADMTITNSTFTGNTATNDGGAIHKGGTGTLTLNNCTITGNTADSDATGGGDGGGIRRGNGDILMANTILAANFDSSASTKHPDCSTGNAAEVVTEGYNLVGIGDLGGCTAFVHNVSGDKVGTNASPLAPMLNALANNGGPTQTMLPMGGSPAIDMGNPNATLDGQVVAGLRNCVAVDQRSFARPFGPFCDIGAAEEGAGITPTATVTATATATSTPTATDTPTATATATATSTATDTATAVPSPTSTATATATSTATSTATNTATATATNTPSATATATNTATATATDTATNTATPTPTDTATPTATDTATSTATNTATNTATATATPTNTATSTATATDTATATATDTATHTPTSTGTATPTSTPTNTPSRTNTPSSTPTRTPTNTPTSTPTRTASVTLTPTPTPDLPDGSVCEDASRCISGFCVDGFCCEDACLGSTNFCSLPGSLGQCVESPAPAPALDRRGHAIALLLLLGLAWAALRRAAVNRKP